MTRVRKLKLGLKEEDTVVCKDNRLLEQEAKTRLSSALDVLASSETKEQSLEALSAMALQMATVREDKDEGWLISRQWNRFDERLNAEVCRAARGLSLVSVAVIDWLVTPSMETISSTLFALRSVLREYDEVYRIEEHALGLILPGVSDRDLAGVASRLSHVLPKHSPTPLRIGCATWSPGQDGFEMLEQARASMQDVYQLRKPRTKQQSGVLLWLEEIPFALPVHAEPKPDGMELCWKLPKATSTAQISLRGGPVSAPYQLREVTLTPTTLRFRVGR